MNFGKNMLSWITSIYHETQSSTQINGYESTRFPLTRGVRQGCPLSVILYSMLAETLGEEIRKSEKLFGIVLPGNHEIKIRQHRDECHHKIKWKNDKGLKILGIKFFPDELQTSNKNWSNQMAELREFVERNRTRKLSLRGKILLLNAKGMAKFWYLATVIPMPKWFLKPTEKLVFEFLWSGSKDPMKREIVYLPIECGGLGLLNPGIQQQALRLRFLQNIINPLCNTKWVILARYWIGFQLASVNTQWIFLRANNLPKPDKPIFPDYYGDILQFAKIADIAKVKWVTKFIYLWLCQQSGLKHADAKCWPHVREVQAEEIWKGTYTSYASGAPQDTHFKFLHGVHKTNWYLKKIMRNRTNTKPFCNACGKTETLAHVFFECEEACDIWKEIKPKIREVLEEEKVQCFKLALKLFPVGTSLNKKKMTITLVQIAMHQIWLNRNLRKHEGVKKNTQASINCMDKYFREYIKCYYVTYSNENILNLFEQRFYQAPSICKLSEDGTLHVSIK